MIRAIRIARMTQIAGVWSGRLDGAPSPQLPAALDRLPGRPSPTALPAGIVVTGSPHSSPLLSTYRSRPRHRRRMPAPVR